MPACLLSIAIFVQSWQKVTPMESSFNFSTDMETNRIQVLFDKYRNNYRLSCKPATENQLQGFRKNCMDYGISTEIMDELVAYFKLNNSFFGYFECDNILIFEWCEQGCLWLGQRELWTFRCLLEKHKYAIGDASEDSFGEDYEFDTIEEMLQAFLSGDKI